MDNRLVVVKFGRRIFDGPLNCFPRQRNANYCKIYKLFLRYSLSDTEKAIIWLIELQPLIKLPFRRPETFSLKLFLK